MPQDPGETSRHFVHDNSTRFCKISGKILEDNQTVKSRVVLQSSCRGEKVRTDYNANAAKQKLAIKFQK